MSVEIRELTAHLGLCGRVVHDIATLVYSTADAYFDFLFLNASTAHQQLMKWCVRPSSEYYLGRAHGVFDGDDCVGIVVHVTGEEIPVLRRADILALLAFRKQYYSPPHVRSNSPATPTAVPPESCYIRAIAVSPRYRGRGYAFQLLTAAEEYAAKIQHHEVRLDVRADNTRAVAVYKQAGLSSVAEWIDVTGHEMLTMRKLL